MADLQEELQRFLTARFGADVRDAFVSCIQKIHKENQDVAALEQPLKDATQQALDIREEITTVSQNASKTAEEAKTIARAAESSASQALATAKNARDDAFNAAGDAELAMAAAQEVEQNYTTMELMLSGKVDGAFVENGYLYLTSNNVVVAGPLGPFSGTGGGSGGSGGNNAILQVSNTSGWLSKSIASGKECPIQITWSSLEDEMPTGNGVMKVTVNGIVKAMLDIPQGAVTADLGPYLSVGSNAVRIQVSDAYENSRTINFNINAIDTLTGNDLAEMQERYPNIHIQYSHFTAQVSFYDDTGSSLLKTVTVYDGGDTAYGSSNPTKTSTAQYSYSFTGWSLTAGGSANANALKAVTVDRNVYAAYSKTVRKYTVYFYNGSTLLKTVSNVPYGSGAYYSGDTPEKTGVDFPEDYVFTGWSPSNNGITGNTYCYAQYKYIGYTYTSIVEGSIAGEYANDRVTAVGDYVFRNCTALTGIRLPSVESIGVCAFLSCTKLTSVSIPAIKTISRSAFSSCSALTGIDLHGVTSIAAMAFYSCTKLTTVILRDESQVCALGDTNVFDSTALAQVFVPSAMVDAYKADSRWSRHASKILAIEDYPDITGG